MSVQRPGLTKPIQILGFLLKDKRTKEKRTVTNPLGGPTFKVKKGSRDNPSGDKHTGSKYLGGQTN